MRKVWLTPLLSWWAVSACDAPCPPGYAPHGRDCAKLPVKDGGGDASYAGGNEPVSRNDGGDDTTTDAGRTPPGVDSGRPASPGCLQDSDCGDLERLHCIGEHCVEHDCYTGKPCTGSDACVMHTCVPFVPPERFPTGYVQTNGGGTVSSAEHRLRWSAGMPQPFGVTRSNNFRVVLGPGAAR